MPSPSMMNIAPSRPIGSGWLAVWNMNADNASEPMFFSPERMSSSEPPQAA